MVEQGEDGGLEDVGRHDWTGGAYLHPVEVVSPDEFGELLVGFGFLGLQQVGHLAVGVGQFEFPGDDSLVDVFPVVDCVGIIDLHAYACEVLAIAGVCDLGHYLSLVEVLLEGEEYLVGVDGFDEVVGNL